MIEKDYPDLSQFKKVLVIKLRHLGDLLLATPVFTLLKAKLPQATIDAYVYEEAFPILEGNEAISNFIIYDRKHRGLIKDVKALWQVYRGKYDLVINLTEGDRGTIATFVSGSKEKVGLYPNGWQKKFYKTCVRHTNNKRHMVERNLDALRCLGISPKEEEKELVFPLCEENLLKVKSKIAPFKEKEYLVLHPASRWRFKWWPLDKMKFLLQKLVERGEKVVLSASEDNEEVAMIEELIEGYKNSSQIVNLAGKCSLKETAALISLSKGIICLDSLALHLASTFKIPTVTLFGASNEHTWGPWKNPKARVASAPFPCRPCALAGCGGSKMSECLSALTVEEVLKLVDEVMSRDR